MQTRCLNFIK